MNDDLESRLDDLESALADLRSELRGPPRIRLRPPRPGELLRLTDEFAIPAAVAALEAQIRALELLQGTIRLARRDRGEASDELRDRTAAATRTALARVDDALSDLRDALDSGPLPDDPQARRILEDARRLNDEIRDRVADAERETDDAVEIDVESELQAIKDDLEDDDRETGTGTSDGNGTGTGNEDDEGSESVDDP